MLKVSLWLNTIFCFFVMDHIFGSSYICTNMHGLSDFKQLSNGEMPLWVANEIVVIVFT